jgi:hypothetical protein
MSRRFLVIVRAGDASLHESWLARDRSYDVFVSYFGDSDLKVDARGDFYEREKGGKWPVIADILARHESICEAYDAVWLPDDDLSCTAEDVDRLFYFTAALPLDLSQPSLTRDSYSSWDVTLHREGCIARFTNFVEIMAPALSRRAIALLGGTFAESRSGWGLDIVWPYLIKKNFGPHKTAIVDAIQVKHTRPVGGGSLYATLGVDAEAEKNALLESYRLPPRFFPEELGYIKATDIQASNPGPLQRLFAPKSRRRRE